MIVSKRELAEIFGKSERAITQFQDDGMPVLKKSDRGKKNQYNTVEVFNWFLERHKKSNLSELDIEDIRLKRATADRAELEYKRMSGELLPVDIIVQAIQSSIITARSRILSVKNDIKIRLPEIPSASLDIIDQTIREAMEDLASSGAPGNLLETVDRYYNSMESAEADEGE